MKGFWFKKIDTKKIKIWNYISRLNFFYVFSLLAFFSFFCIYNKFTKIVIAKDKVEILQDNIQDIAIYMYNINEDFSKFLFSLDLLIKEFNIWNNIFDHIWDIEYILNYFQKNWNDLYKYWFFEYKDFLNFFSWLVDYKDELYDLLWKEEQQNYIIVLQNTNEKRPNWGFFGSFALLKINKWQITYEIIDSYKADYLNPWITIKTPEWFSKNIWTSEFGFISSNKFWFTRVDWFNIQKLYQDIFKEKIRWVIFVKSSFIEKLIPWIDKKFEERQFINASIDLIKWESIKNKKQIYLKEINDYLSDNINTIVKSSIKNFSIWDDNNVNIYLDDISDDLENFLLFNGFINKFYPSNIYFWDTNISYNKIDRFITKNIEIYDQNDILLIDSNSDIVNVSALEKWEYTIKINYFLSVKQSYIDYIERLENKYNIKLWAREIHILWLKQNWITRWEIYFPKNINIKKVEWNWYYIKNFETQFSNNLSYKIWINWNNKLWSVEISIVKE
jgi:hypothetical protein